MKKSKSLRVRIILTMLVIEVVTLVLVGGLLFASMYEMYRRHQMSIEKIGGTAEESSGQSMVERMRDRLDELALDKASLADNMFVEFERDVIIQASAASQLYNDPESYSPRYVPEPDAANDGKLAIQMLYADGVDKDDEAIVAEAGLIGNMQDMLLSLNGNNNIIISNYVATESGLMLQADYISGKKIDKDGNIMPYNAKERSWYKGAKETGQPYFTNIKKDAHTTRIGMMCGVPIYHNGELKGVAGAGMYLENIEAIVQSANIGETGEAFILNQSGQVLISTENQGELAVSVDGADLRTVSNTGLAEIAKEAVNGRTGSGLADINGKPCYLSYAPMNTVGWSFIIIVSVEEVEQPTIELMESIQELTNETIKETGKHIQNTVVFILNTILVLAVLVVLLAFSLSARIVKPISDLTEGVSEIKGDNLDFECNITTGDEIQVLGDSFQSLTERMKTYIKEIQSITAEKERIGAELDIAKQIQADMLPSIFPPFPERSDFDIYATMTPAKQVGGDFYDFYLLDDDHLAITIADVSGKGVPAALFMVISKTLIKDQAQSFSSPKEILEKVNNMLVENNAEGMFVTVWLGIMTISTGDIIAANAGHEYPALKKADGNFELYNDKHGFIVGGMEDTKYKEYEMHIENGGCLFLYTDGVPEATNTSDELYGTDRMLEALNKDPGAEPADLLKSVKESIDEFVGDAPQFDDLTMLAVIRR